MISTMLLAHPIAVAPAWLAWLLAMLCVSSLGVAYRLEWRRFAGPVVCAVVVACSFYIFIACGWSCNCDWSNLWCAI